MSYSRSLKQFMMICMLALNREKAKLQVKTKKINMTRTRPMSNQSFMMMMTPVGVLNRIEK